MFIVIDGIDGAGKATQTRMLRERLTNSGYDAVSVSFPRYDEWSAVFVERYLAGHMGDPNAIDPYVASTFYTLDRIGYRETLMRDIRTRDFVISDRYSTASFFHRGSDVLAHSGREALSHYTDWLYDFEFVRAQLPKPDIVCLLSLDPTHLPATLSDRVEEGKRTDRVDHDMDHQVRAAALALEVLPRYFHPCVVIKCGDGEDGRLSPLETHEHIYHAILARYEELHPVRRIDTE